MDVNELIQLVKGAIYIAGKGDGNMSYDRQGPIVAVLLQFALKSESEDLIKKALLQAAKK